MPTSKSQVFNELSETINGQIVKELISEYDIAKRALYSEDWEKSVLHAGKFSELTMAAIKNIVDKTNVDLNNIHFDELFKEMTARKKITPVDEILMLAIPRAALSAYCIRNKKRVAHVKSINPDVIDSQFCLSACDWILSQFIMLYVTSNPEETSILVHSLIEKQIPFIEQFEDGSLVILDQALNFKQQLMVSLYKLGRRISRKDLIRILSTYPQLMNTTVKNLEESRIVHSNLDGVILTKKGIQTVETEILKGRYKFNPEDIS